jgi:hypothetical protein
MSRIDRLKEYANPMHGQRNGRFFGSASDKENLAEWSARASANSDGADHRAKGPVHGGPPGTHGEDQPSLPSTKVTTRDTAMRPFESRKIDKLMKGEDAGDKNNVGSSFMKSVRREA